MRVCASLQLLLPPPQPGVSYTGGGQVQEVPEQAPLSFTGRYPVRVSWPAGTFAERTPTDSGGVRCEPEEEENPIS